ncbi:hypothetical protein EZS27_029483 [termite gut metagenome]|uniref:Uncharacterized protein n=1 Tax=termite gut metagenome TaxID=433724 RepID=A0A5J4QIJ3_9ZZZZ
METNKFIGIVTEIADNHNFIFRVNSNYKCQLQQVVGLNISNNTFVLASITNIDVGYFLKDKEEYIIPTRHQIAALIQLNSVIDFRVSLSRAFITSTSLLSTSPRL